MKTKKKVKKAEWPEFMVKVRLPDSACYASCSSGDTDYEVEYNKAMEEAIPEGFVAVKPRLGHHWPVDSEEYTYVPLKCTDSKNVISKLKAENKDLRTRLENVKEAWG